MIVLLPEGCWDVLIYLPIMAEDLFDFATNWNNSRAALGFKDAASGVFVHGRGAKPLSGIGRNDTLFLLCHGSEKSPSRIGAQVGTRKTLFGRKPVYEVISATECADRMVADGLTRELGDLRLLVCWAGMGRKREKAPFAGQLCAALKDRGFYRIIVTGYTGAVQMTPYARNVLISPGLTRRTHNTNQAAWVDQNPAGFQKAGLANTGNPNTTLEEMFKQAVADANGRSGGSFSLSDAFRTVWY